MKSYNDFTSVEELMEYYNIKPLKHVFAKKEEEMKKTLINIKKMNLIKLLNQKNLKLCMPILKQNLLIYLNIL